MTDSRKTRYAIVDFGRVVHPRTSPCPPWCHLCPHMPRNAVLPYCFGSVTGHQDEYDLTACTCDPCDPFVAQLDLISRTATLAELLRDRRRERRYDRRAIDRLLQVARVMRGTHPAWREVESIARRLGAATEEAEATDARFTPVAKGKVLGSAPEDLDDATK